MAAKQNIYRLLKALWIKSCRFDGLNVNSKFVIFSEENPYIKKYNRIASLQLQSKSFTNDGFNKKVF